MVDEIPVRQIAAGSKRRWFRRAECL